MENTASSHALKRDLATEVESKLSIVLISPIGCCGSSVRITSRAAGATAPASPLVRNTIVMPG